jgi:uncharacterized membrane protein
LKKTIIQPHKSSLGMDANLTSLIIFIGMAVVAWIPYVRWIAFGVPLVFYFMEKYSGFVKFQAVTALILGIIWSALSIIFNILTWILTPKYTYGIYGIGYSGSWGAWVLMGTILTIISIIFTLIEIYLIVMAYGYKQVELPFIGPIAARVSEKLNKSSFNQQKPGGQNYNPNQPPPNYNPNQQQGYAPPPQQQQGYAPPPQPQQGYAPPPQPQQGYAPPQQPQQGYAPPPQPQQGYAPPQQPQQGYAPPPQPQQGYAPPPQQQQGYAPPPQQQQGYAPPQQPQQGYAPPQQPQQGYAPPPGYNQNNNSGPYGQ